jgi:uncharacterized protein YcaQ
MLTRIRNGQQAKKDSVLSPASKLRSRVLEVLQREGYIRGYSEDATGVHPQLRIELKYFEGEAAIKHLARVSAGSPCVLSKELLWCVTALASPSSRRRVACSRMPKRALPTSVAKCWRRCSNEPHWKPVAIPAGVSATSPMAF